MVNEFVVGIVIGLAISDIFVLGMILGLNIGKEYWKINIHNKEE